MYYRYYVKPALVTWYFDITMWDYPKSSKIVVKTWFLKLKSSKNNLKPSKMV